MLFYPVGELALGKVGAFLTKIIAQLVTPWYFQ
jgi:hypothetical protein